jgi:hypothetical protein
VFVDGEVVVGLPYEAAKQALGRALADGGLVAESRRAVSDGLVFVMPVGPRGSHGPARDVLVRLLPGRETHPHRFLVALRWEAVGAAGRLFPALDADLELAAGDQPDRSRLSIVGCYQPPLGWLGRQLDRTVMSKIASVTMTALLREVASQVTRPLRSSAAGLQKAPEDDH